MFTKRCVRVLLIEFYFAIELLLLFVCCAPIDKTNPNELNSAVPTPQIFDFMRKFGYLEKNPSTSEALYHEDAIIEALKNVQKFGAIPQTGKLDNETMKLITSPRCGVSDIVGKKPSQLMRINRSKRFVIGSSGWKRRKITYFIANWSPKVGEDKIAEHMKNAFNTWAKYGKLKFVRVYDPSADIIIGFGSSYHGDNYPFDGPGNILAHAFYPYEMNSFGGDIHFDNDENWVENATNLNEGVDFFSVAVHELGHSLGLAHSFVYSSIMFPYYKGLTKLQQLDYDDILAMYQLYIQNPIPDGEDVEQEDVITTTQRYFNYDEDDRSGGESSSTTARYRTPTTALIPRSTESTTVIQTSTTRRMYHTPTRTTRSPIGTTTEQLPFITFEGDYESVDDHKKRWMITTSSTSQEEIPNPCLGHFDAVSVIRGEAFIFKGRYLWRLNDKFRIKEGYPVTINKIFRDFPNDKVIDAAYERDSDSAIVLFSGKQYWVYNGTMFIENTPRPISDYVQSDEIESIDAVLIWGKNGKTYLFSGNKFWRYNDSIKRLDDDYPMTMDRWNGIPKDLDAAVTLTNGKSYFFKGNYYWAFNNNWVKPEIGYPRQASSIWLGCSL